jgi:hypothetical protein
MESGYARLHLACTFARLGRSTQRKRGSISARYRLESRDLDAENKTVTDTTFIRFRGPQALKDI